MTNRNYVYNKWRLLIVWWKNSTESWKTVDFVDVYEGLVSNGPVRNAMKYYFHGFIERNEILLFLGVYFEVVKSKNSWLSFKKPITNAFSVVFGTNYIKVIFG